MIRRIFSFIILFLCLLTSQVDRAAARKEERYWQ